MGSSPQPTDHVLDPTFAAALRAEADATGFVSFERFMALALYHPQLGFYTREQDRVGRRASAHFYTATSLGPVFGELIVAAACHHLQARDADPAAYRFVELGAEGGRSVLDDIAHPFAAVETCGVADVLSLTGACVVFSNELFDAQPCARYLRCADGWHEQGLRFADADRIAAALRPVGPDAPALPDDCAAGYALDLPRQADALAARIGAQPWHGLFLAFDYGKTWHELVRETPQGSVRAYFHHRQSNDLLAQPGRQDLTCHVCWDTLAAALQAAGFTADPVLSQEAFLVKNCAAALQQIMTAEAPSLSARKAGLMQLLHPSSLGQKFQVLAAWRSAGNAPAQNSP